LGFFQSFTGTYAVGAVIYAALGDTMQSNAYIKQVQDAMPYGLLSTDFSFSAGVPGLIYTAEYLNWYFQKNVINASSIDALARYLIERGVYFGKQYGNGTYLLWKYGNDWKAFGQGQGMLGTLQYLLSTDYVFRNASALALVKATVDMMVDMLLPSGQFPDPSAAPDPDDQYPLVQWCHGAPGALQLYSRAYEVFRNPKYLAAAELAADYTWKRGLLTKGLMTCHGISGNAYMILTLYRATNNDKYLWRAIKFQEFVLHTPIVSDITLMRLPTPSPFSVWQGSWTGAALLWSDMLNIMDAESWCIPGIENCL